MILKNEQFFLVAFAMIINNMNSIKRVKINLACFPVYRELFQKKTYKSIFDILEELVPTRYFILEIYRLMIYFLFNVSIDSSNNRRFSNGDLII